MAIANTIIITFRKVIAKPTIEFCNMTALAHFVPPVHPHTCFTMSFLDDVKPVAMELLEGVRKKMGLNVVVLIISFFSNIVQNKHCVNIITRCRC